MTSIKKIFLNTTYTFYGLLICSALSIIGAFLIYFNPDIYYTIDYKALFKWLYFNQTFKNFWIYLVIVTFTYLGLSSLFCIFYDIKRKNIFTFLFHISFVIVLLGHIISGIYYFKIPNYAIPEGVPKTINLPDSHKPLNIYLDKLSYDITKEGYPKNIRGEVIYLDDKEEKKGTISINNPLKIGKYYLVLKHISPFLRSIMFKLKSDDERLLIPILSPETPFIIDGIVFEFLAHNEDMSMYKVMVQDGDKKEVMIWSYGQNVNIRGVNYTITKVVPDTIGSMVIDIVYDPSLKLIFIASTIFVFSAVIRFFQKNE